MKKKLLYLCSIIIFFSFIFFAFKSDVLIGLKIDSYNGVPVYYNGYTGNVSGRNKTEDGYNLGLKYQCVEYVKRYYYEHLNHKMPYNMGHANSFFNNSIKDGDKNTERNLYQFTNPSFTKPEDDDLIVMGGGKFGHVAIVTKVTDNKIEIIQQNPSNPINTREKFNLIFEDSKWYINNKRILGWLRKKN